MNYEHLSEEAKEVLKGMVEHCINLGYCMGMDEGIKDFDTQERQPFREELEKFCGYVE